MKKLLMLIIVFFSFIGLIPVNLLSQSSQEEDLKNFSLLSEVGEHHKILSMFAGEWRVNFVNYNQGDATPGMGESKSQLIYGGRYLEIKNQIVVLGTPSESTSLIGYDNRKEKYLMVSYDNSTTYPSIFEGTYDAEKKELTFTGRDYMIFLKKEVEIKVVLTSNRENKFSSKFYYGTTAKPTLSMELVYIRK